MVIAACMMVRNMAWFIPAAISSLDWVDLVYLLDDHSTDDTATAAKLNAPKHLIVEESPFAGFAFEEGELKVRNYALERAFELTGASAVVVVDGDEIFSSELRGIIERAFTSGRDSICTSTFHLRDLNSYLHFWVTKINKTVLIDPHTRVVSREKRYFPLYRSGAHPIIPATKQTLCVSEMLHFHLKYFHLNTQPNYSLTFLPKWLSAHAVRPYLRPLPTPLPAAITNAIQMIRWPNSRRDTDYYKVHRVKRVKFSRPEQALVHPRDAGPGLYEKPIARY
jgi:glycosyltransferase involved in cell wall biosynthesis